MRECLSVHGSILPSEHQKTLQFDVNRKVFVSVPVCLSLIVSYHEDFILVSYHSLSFAINFLAILLFRFP